MYVNTGNALQVEIQDSLEVDIQDALQVVHALQLS